MSRNLRVAGPHEDPGLVPPPAPKGSAERAVWRGLLLLALAGAVVVFLGADRHAGEAYIAGTVALAGLACSSRP